MSGDVTEIQYSDETATAFTVTTPENLVVGKVAVKVSTSASANTNVVGSILVFDSTVSAQCVFPDMDKAAPASDGDGDGDGNGNTAELPPCIIPAAANVSQSFDLHGFPDIVDVTSISAKVTSLSSQASVTAVVSSVMDIDSETTRVNLAFPGWTSDFVSGMSAAQIRFVYTASSDIFAMEQIFFVRSPTLLAATLDIPLIRVQFDSPTSILGSIPCADIINSTRSVLLFFFFCEIDLKITFVDSFSKHNLHKKIACWPLRMDRLPDAYSRTRTRCSCFCNQETRCFLARRN